MANEKMRAALEAAKAFLAEMDEGQEITPCTHEMVVKIDKALKSEPTPAVTVLDQRLAVLPETLERNAYAVLDLQIETCQQEREIELLQAENAYEAFTNPDYKHDTVRNAKLVMSLQTSEAYYEKQKALDKTKILLQRARIAYQRSRDMFDAYRSIAGMGARV